MNVPTLRPGLVEKTSGRSALVPRASMGDTDGWRRAALDYRSKFEEDFVFSVPGAREGAPPLRIAQAPSATAAEKRVGCRRPAAPADRRGAGESRARGAQRASPSSEDGSDDAKDPIPATGFTVWDAGVLLGAYVSQPEVWRRLTMPERARDLANVPTIPDRRDDDATATKNLSPLLEKKKASFDDSLTVLELGAGTGVAGLALAATGLPTAVALTDLPGVCDFLRHNASRNKETQSFSAARTTKESSSRKSIKKTAKDNTPIHPENAGGISLPAIPTDVALAVAPLRWGVKQDVAKLHPSFRNPKVLLGADLAYTEDVSVVRRLAATVSSCVPFGGVAVFASCRDHRPESVDLLEKLLVSNGEFEARRVRGDELAEGFGRIERREEDEEKDGRFESFRVVEFRRVAGDGMSDAEAEAIRARDAHGDAQ
jgi:predicted nicotinamide N-methyase